MRLPSVKTIGTRLLISNERARMIRKRMEQVRDGAKRVYEALEIIDETLGTHGVESIGQQTSTVNVLAYCNAGDPYLWTVMYDFSGKGFIVGAWGDMVEKFPGKFDSEA